MEPYLLDVDEERHTALTAGGVLMGCACTHIARVKHIFNTGPCEKNARRPGFQSQNTSSKKSQNVQKVSTLAIPKVSRGPKICFRDFGRN